MMFCKRGTCHQPTTGTDRTAGTEAPTPLDKRQDEDTLLSAEQKQLCGKYITITSNNDDVVIESSDGVVFLLSRYQLASESLFFQALFCGTYTESDSSRVRLTCVSAYDFHVCLSLSTRIKNGTMPELTAEAAMNAMVTASFLQMPLLMEELSSIIVTRVHISNLLIAYRKAAVRNAALASQLWERIIKEFRLLSKSDYETMTEREMVTALLDERLNIACEDEEPLINNWIEKNPGNHDRIARLKSEAFHHRGTDGRFDTVVRDRLPREVLLAMGGWITGGPTDIVEVFSPRAQMWMVPEVIVRETPRAYHGAALCGDKIVVVGGVNRKGYSKDAKCFNLNDKSWEDFPKMYDRRCYVAATPYTGSSGAHHLVAMGGYNGHRRLNSAEILHVEKNHWCHLPPLSKNRSDAGAAVLAGRPTVVGGFDGGTIHNDIEMLDFGSLLWLKGSHSMRSVRTGASVVTYERNCLIVAGGFDGFRPLKSMEFYDHRVGRWYRLPKLLTTRSNFGMELMNGSLYIAGGFDGICTSSTLDRFDMRGCYWEAQPSMKIPKSALRLIRIADHDIISSLVNFQSQPIDFEVDLGLP